MANIFLSVPILDKPEFKMIYSMYQAILSCGQHRVRLFVNENDSLISRVRNVHMSLFLNDFKECDYFVSIDSDLDIVNCYNTNNIFTKLVSHDKDFVGGLYALKQWNGSAKCASVPLDMGLERTGIQFDKGLIPIRWLSAGCWCLKRSAVEKMVNAYPELDYVGDDNVTGKIIHGLYNPEIFEIEDRASNVKFRKYLSEDWSFCERWTKIGGEIFADTSIVLKHQGKYPYALWNVKVEPRKVEDSKPKIDPSSIKIEKLEEKPLPKDFRLPPLPGDKLPPAGWDLANLK